MADFNSALKETAVAAEPTLKERVRERLPDIEDARTKKTPWKRIRHALEAIGIAIDLQLLANYVCELRKEFRMAGSHSAPADRRRMAGSHSAPADRRTFKHVSQADQLPSQPKGESLRRRDDLIEGPDVA